MTEFRFTSDRGCFFQTSKRSDFCNPQSITNRSPLNGSCQLTTKPEVLKNTIVLNTTAPLSGRMKLKAACVFTISASDQTRRRIITKAMLRKRNSNFVYEFFSGFRRLIT